MQIKSQDTGINTRKLAESREFYTRVFGFEVVWDGGSYIHLRNGDIELGLLQPGQKDQPPVFQKEFAGEGAWISWEVEDVDAECARIAALGLPLACPLSDEPWGERHFAVRDPNGVGINIMSVIPMTAEYAARTTGSAVASQ
jgi:catechol 2,3-dioxygenase-like lactoylglutathione lyase family enzyme